MSNDIKPKKSSRLFFSACACGEDHATFSSMLCAETPDQDTSDNTKGQRASQFSCDTLMNDARSKAVGDALGFGDFKP